VNLANADSINYGDVSLSGGFQSGHFYEVWNLTACDLTISFTYNANGLVDDFGGGAHAWAELGVREFGYGDFNPTWMTGGAGVWLATDYEWSVNTFDPDTLVYYGEPYNNWYGTLDLDDKLILQRGGGMDESYYNLPSSPPNAWANHRVWWDRDGVDPWQNPATANTGGIYNIVITLHATSPTTGTAYMNIRGLDQGFETDGNWNTIELTPAGMTFTGDMAMMQVFYGLYGYGATHSIAFEDITVKGCLYGGFVSGGGWIDSPEGAYIAEPTLAGRANFGFISKYKKGASVPDGQTEFMFQTADLNFHSNTYDWLVVNQAGTNAQYKGSGTINGEGDYKFMLWAGDGDPDTFRIKIWEEGELEVETVVYDNGTEQAIAGGSIVVHTK
jgi:hypothetical protein